MIKNNKHRFFFSSKVILSTQKNTSYNHHIYTFSAKSIDNGPPML